MSVPSRSSGCAWEHGDSRPSSSAGSRWAATIAVALALSGSIPTADAGLARPPLSERELEVAALAAAGLSNRAIADRLFLSPRTVEKHVEHVMDKLGVGSRAEIAAWHAREGAGL